ncbi:MAG: peptidoglycan DD-metalloendopeptidase family protein [Candidatus Peribacteraceae bacterium]|nr:peptidoglycan DD-metalloendopeptidase family protein [Candidatus Peribacteraceae bacterium]
MKILKLISFVLALAILTTPFVNAAIEREGIFDQASKTVDALLFVRNAIDEKYETYLNSAGRVDQIVADKLPLLEAKINTLSAQLRNFDENLAREKVNLQNLQDQTKAVQLELIDLGELTEMREVELDRSQDLLNEFIRIAYAETMQYTDWETGEVSTLKFLFTDESLADVETKKSYLDVLQNVSAGLILDLQKKQADYEKVKASLLAKRGELILLQQEILLRTRELEKMRAGKQALLNETRGQEAQYRKLVEESKRQQLEALAEINELKSQLGVIDGKLKTLKGSLSEEDFARLLEDQSIASIAGVIFPNRIPKVLWPASPARGITAYYHDSSYVTRFGVAHQAVDFRLTQGSRVAAAAPGIVYKAKDNGYGYSYITIAHPGGLATVYGHISKILVKEGDIVRAGDLIGLSGGIPGTKGAGYMTTGAHLHFEVIDHGEHADPLDYLPLEKMRLDDIPKKYLDEAVEL